MDISINISVYPKVEHPDGHITEGEPEILTFDEERLIEILRMYSQIPAYDQRHWQFDSVEFK